MSKTEPQIGTIFVECGDHFARDSVVQETGLKWLGELGLTILCTDNDVQSSNPRFTCVFLRQMLGAISEFVCKQIRERLSHGFQKTLREVANDPSGRRSHNNRPKLGGPPALLETDKQLNAMMKAFAAKSQSQKLTLKQIAAELHRKSSKWSVQTETNNGKPWSPKQMRSFLQKFN